MDLLNTRFVPLVAALAAACTGCDAWRGGKAPGPADRAAPDFSLVDTQGNRVTLADLRGKVWIASFMFTRCTLGCPQVAESVRDLQNRLRDRKDLVFVSFAVDPDRDDADELKRYGAHFGADPGRWLFLRGEKSALDRLVMDGFQMAISRDGTKPIGEDITHPLKLVLVDREGFVRSRFPGLANPLDAPGTFQEEQRDLRAQVDILLRERPWTGWVVPSAELNAFLNGLAGALMVAAIAAIKAGRRKLHGGLMLGALVASALFLASYLVYHIFLKHGVATSFASRAPGAPLGVVWAYLAILLTHTVLAIGVTPMALVVASLGLRGGESLIRHKAIARWVYPLWLYVAMTGVLVYWMLYRLPGSAGWN